MFPALREMMGRRERGALWAMSLSKPACYWSVCSTGLLPLITSLFEAASDINNSTAAPSGWRKDNSKCGIMESTKKLTLALSIIIIHDVAVTSFHQNGKCLFTLKVKMLHNHRESEYI